MVGVIGDVESVDVDLSADKLERYCFTDKEFDVKQALQRSLSILDTADYSITMPLIAITYLAPLYSLLKEIDIDTDLIIFVQGKSGTRKSSIVAATVLSHFGKFSRTSFPSNFRDSINSIEKKAFILKDSINCVDDYFPEVNGKNTLYTVEKIYGMYGDRVSRTRMSKDGSTLKAPYIARGLCVLTGEVSPEVRTRTCG